MTSFKSDGKAILIVTIGALIAIAFLATIADSIFEQTNTIAFTNVTVTSAAVNTTLDVTGRQLLTTVQIYNSSNFTDSLVNSGGSLQTGAGSSGLLSVQLLLNDTASAYAGKTINISYTANPDGYLSLGSSRSIANLIIIFGSLAVLIFVIIVFIMNGSMGKLIRGEK